MVKFTSKIETQLDTVLSDLGPPFTNGLIVF